MTKMMMRMSIMVVIKMPVMIMKIKMPAAGQVMMIMKMIRVEPGMDTKMMKVVIRAGCKTLIIKICFSRRRVTPEPLLERELSWSK